MSIAAPAGLARIVMQAGSPSPAGVVARARSSYSVSGSRLAKVQVHRDDGAGTSRPAVTIRSSGAAPRKPIAPAFSSPTEAGSSAAAAHCQSTGHHVWCRLPSQLCRFEMPLQAMRIVVSLKLKS